MVDRQPAWTPSHDGERHCRPREMDRPTIRNGQLDDTGHQQETGCGKARPEAEHQKHRKYDFTAAGEERHDRRRRKIVRATGKMQLELVGKKIDRRVIQLKEPIPFQDAGFPERHRKGQPKHQLSQRWLRDPGNDPKRLVDDHRQKVNKPARLFLLAGFHRQSPRCILLKTAASIIPAMLAGRSKEDVSEKAMSAAALKVPPSIKVFRKAAPPGGRSRTATSMSGRVISASSAALDRIAVMGLSTRFTAKIATAGYADRTMRAAGCAVKMRSPSLSDGTAASASGDKGSASAAWYESSQARSMRAVSASHGMSCACSYPSINAGKSLPYSNSSGDLGGVARICKRAMARKNSTPVIRWTAGKVAASASIRLT